MKTLISEAPCQGKLYTNCIVRKANLPMLMLQSLKCMGESLRNRKFFFFPSRLFFLFHLLSLLLFDVIRIAVLRTSI